MKVIKHPSEKTIPKAKTVYSGYNDNNNRKYGSLHSKIYIIIAFIIFFRRLINIEQNIFFFLFQGCAILAVMLVLAKATTPSGNVQKPIDDKVCWLIFFYETRIN